jgi:hypothetical protein
MSTPGRVKQADLFAASWYFLTSSVILSISEENRRATGENSEKNCKMSLYELLPVGLPVAADREPAPDTNVRITFESSVIAAERSIAIGYTFPETDSDSRRAVSNIRMIISVSSLSPVLDIASATGCDATWNSAREIPCATARAWKPAARGAL